jgi:tryptophan-rich sensory protein
MRRFRYAAAVAVAAAGGGAATRRSVATWYPGLRKPGWTPPSQVFGPVWTVLYAQMAYSASRIARSSDPGRRRALALWWLQLGLNAAWSPVFFGAAALNLEIWRRNRSMDGLAARLAGASG